MNETINQNTEPLEEDDDEVLFNQEELDRYARTMALKEIGYEGQVKLKKSKVLVVGAGGLGSPALQNLTGSGVGTIGICDKDVVDLSNLQRQIIHSTEAALKGTHKVDSAIEALQRLNPDVMTIGYKAEMDQKLAEELVPQYDIVLDCLDNFPTRFILSDVCARLQKPLVTAAVDRYRGTISVMCTEKAPCMRCYTPEVPPPGDEPRCVGLFGTLTGVLGTMQAEQALKLLLKFGVTLEGRTLYYDAEHMQVNVVGPMMKNPDCAWCKARVAA